MNIIDNYLAMPNKLFEIIAGANGSGKSTLAKVLTKNRQQWRYINADIIAEGLASKNSKANLDAGKLLLSNVKSAILANCSFGFETTMAGRIWSEYIKQAKIQGFTTRIVYLILQDPDLCLQRIKQRVSLGGHNIDSEVVKRRYYRSKSLFCSYYQQQVDEWLVIDNSSRVSQVVARKSSNQVEIFAKELFNQYFPQDFLLL